MKKMKRKKVLLSVLSTIVCIAPLVSPVYAEEKSNSQIIEEYSPNKEYSCNESIVYNNEMGIYEVIQNDDTVQRRASYTNRGSVNINGQVIYAYISVDASTGKIVSTSISQPPAGSGTTARYNVSFNASKTIAYFTITLYSTAYGGSIYQALGTKYVNIYSGGPM